MARYIELSSHHRNRVKYPHPAEFEVPFLYTSPSDPVLTGSIYYQWTSDEPSTFLPFKQGTSNSSPALYVSNANPQPALPRYYNGYVMMVTSPSVETRIVTDYQPQSVSVMLDRAFSFTPPYSLQPGDLYLLFELNTPSVIHLPFTDGTGRTVREEAEAYYGYYIVDETLSYGNTIVGRKIVDYDAALRYCHLESEFPMGWAITDSYTLRKTLPLEKWMVVASSASGGIVQITLPVTASVNASYYVGKYVLASDMIFPILAYDGGARILSCGMSSAFFPAVGETINIVVLEGYNTAPLSYMGTLVSQNETVCYEVALTSLTLPNLTLMTGSRIAFYPYVYVEFVNSTSFSSLDVIYSNNPSSYRALFIVHVTDVVQPVNGRFVKLLGKMRQTISFKPNDSLRFRVFLPDGTLFQTLEADRFSPYEPNEHLQIDALFSFRRL